jgi:hypothetical protein
MQQYGAANRRVVSSLTRVTLLLCWLVPLARVAAVGVFSRHDQPSPAARSRNLHAPRHADVPVPPCIYKQWSAWSGDCPPPDACEGGFRIRNRDPTNTTTTTTTTTATTGNTAANTSCIETEQQKTCAEDCVHVLATKGLIVIGMIDNPASTEEEEDIDSPLLLEDVRYMYGSLSKCSPGCQDVPGLDADHDIVCVMCTNLHSCRRAGALHLNKSGKLDVIRSIRKGPYIVQAEEQHCSCYYTPDFPLMTGMCSAPSYYINFTVL